MDYTIEELYELLNESIKEAIKDNISYEAMDIFGDDEIQLTIEDDKVYNITINIEEE